MQKKPGALRQAMEWWEGTRELSAFWNAADWWLIWSHCGFSFLLIPVCMLWGPYAVMIGAITGLVVVVAVAIVYKRAKGWRWPGPSIAGIIGAIPCAAATAGVVLAFRFVLGKQWEYIRLSVPLALLTMLFDLCLFGTLLCLGLADFTRDAFEEKCKR